MSNGKKERIYHKIVAHKDTVLLQIGMLILKDVVGK